MRFNYCCNNTMNMFPPMPFGGTRGSLCSFGNNGNFFEGFVIGSLLNRSLCGGQMGGTIMPTMPMPFVPYQTPLMSMPMPTMPMPFVPYQTPLMSMPMPTMPAMPPQTSFTNPSLFTIPVNSYTPTMLPSYGFGMSNFNMNFGTNFNYNFGTNPFNNISSNTSTNTSTSTNTNSTNTNNKDDGVINYDAKSLKDKWSKKAPSLSNNFYNKVIDISKKLNCDPNDLMAVMYSESRLKPNARNKSSNATGLIQFMPSTAQRLGTNINVLINMSAEDQLNYVEKYLNNCKKYAKINANTKIDRGTLYALIFMPGKASNEVLVSIGTKAYSMNKGLDKNQDGKITKTDLSIQLQSYMA